MDVNFRNIATDDRLLPYCRELAEADSIAMDTEFVAEHTYRPVLCLIQVAAGGELSVIDPMGIEDLTPFWETIAAEGHETIVHAGRGDVEFCLQAIGRYPAGLFDVQIAAALAGMEYPAGYGTLIAKLLGNSSKKHETRTDWRRRPLSHRQIEYALDDVRYLHPLRDTLRARLGQLGRLDWFEQEMTDWQDEIQQAQTQQRWRQVSGNSGLDRRSLAILRELWRWREAEALRRNKPPRRVLRDDLIVELARRRTAEVKRIRAVRGLERGDLRRRLGEIAKCIQRGLDLPEEECPDTTARRPKARLSVLGQFLFSALGSICREAHLAPNLVGTPADIREWIAYRTTGRLGRSAEPPKLARGWRAQFVGRLFDDLLDGKISARVADPDSDHPLRFDRGESGTVPNDG